jgi:hypothetical protein
MSAPSAWNFCPRLAYPCKKQREQAPCVKSPNPGRVTGLLYLLASIVSVVGLLYVPSKLIADTDAGATARNLIASEGLFRLGIAANLTSQVLFIFVALGLFHLLQGVNRRLAQMMLVLILTAIPIALLNELNALAALILVRGAEWLAPLAQQQRESLALLFLHLHGSAMNIAGILWGLWLFPLGLLVYCSGFLPKFLGIILMVNCFAYPINSFTWLLLPQHSSEVARWISPLQFGEFIFMLWLVVAGAHPKPSSSDRVYAADAPSQS